jgi:ABC-type lipoprotein release transport system permease subunit
MKTLWKIAWRNIWRNPRRSWVLISAIGIGVFCFIGTVSFYDGFAYEMVNSMIQLYGGHIQIAAKDFHSNPVIHSYIQDPDRVKEALSEIEGIHFAEAVTFQGMVNSSEQASGVAIFGVNPEREPGVSIIPQLITNGTYLSRESSDHEIIMGEALAERLNVDLGEKIVLMVNDLKNDISAGAYRITGLFRSTSPDFDRSVVFLHLQEAQSLVGYSKEVSTFTLQMEQGMDLDAMTTNVREKLKDSSFEVLSWRERFPIIVMMLKAMDYSVIVLIVVLFIAIAFTIINSFLMVIFERIHEIGIMMANGVLPKQIRSMLYFEAVFLILLGTAFGLIISAGIVGLWSYKGLDLSPFAKGLGIYNIGSVIYPYVDLIHILRGFLIIVLIVFLAIIYPSVKASRFKPVEAMRHV